jgi:hypothetical protein
VVPTSVRTDTDAVVMILVEVLAGWETSVVENLVEMNVTVAMLPGCVTRATDSTYEVVSTVEVAALRVVAWPPPPLYLQQEARSLTSS